MRSFLVPGHCDRCSLGGAAAASWEGPRGFTVAPGQPGKRLRRPRGEAAKHYNVLQKLTYLLVIFLLLPAMVLSGLTMSPAVTAAAPFLFDLFAGRQSARTIHFIAANLLLLFVLVHVVQVALFGAFNLMRSMITGRYAVVPERMP